MSFDPRLVVGAAIYGAGAAPKVGYTNGSDGATAPLPRGYIFKGLLRLSPISTKFSPYSASYAVDESVGTAWGPLP